MKTATLSAGVALHAPGLAGQIFANSKGVNSDDLRRATHREPSISQVLNDPRKRSLLESLLTSSTVSQAQIDAGINLVAGKGNIQNSAQLRQNLVNAFVAQGISLNEAEILANEGVSIVQAESSNQALNASLLNKNANLNTLEQILVTQSVSSSKASEIAQEALVEVIANPYITNNQEFQLALQFALEQYGLNAAQATAASQAYVNGVVAASPPVNPILNPEFTGALTQPQLAEAIHTHVYGQLVEPLGPEKARETANQTTTALVGIGNRGNPSLLESLNTQNEAQLSHERHTKGTPAENRLAEGYSDYIRPSQDLYNFSKNIQDPGHTLTMLGPMYSPKSKPSNFQHPLDVWV